MSVEELVHAVNDCELRCPHAVDSRERIAEQNFVVGLRSQSVEKGAVEALAESLSAACLVDPVAVLALFQGAVPCNQAMADHPGVEVRDDKTVTVLGVLQSFAFGYGKNIVLTIDDKGRAIRFDAVRHYSVANQRCSDPDTLAVDPRMDAREKAAKADLGKL